MRINLPAVWFTGSCLMPVKLFAATTLWSTDINFNEFLGNAGGFSATATTLSTSLDSQPVVQSFDIVRPVGIDPASGKMIYAEGQDGIPDMVLTARTISANGDRWGAAYTRMQQNLVRSVVSVGAGESQSGDSALNVVEISFNQALGITADQFAMRLNSTNGTSELYEWTMVTVGAINDAPFTPQQIQAYTPADYSVFTSGTFYNALGQPTGAAGTGNRLDTGKSISQFLSGGPATAVSGGLVQDGWYSIDDFNARIYDAPEDDDTNPVAGDGAIDDNQTVTGLTLGGNTGDSFQTVTLWFGLHDVALDSNGDGFTGTNGNVFEGLTQITIGASAPDAVPEPGKLVLLGISGIFLLSIRKRQRQG